VTGTRIADADPCPCGSGARYDACCGPALRGTPPTTAEALMRSRYTANVVGDADYLRASWHPGTAPASIDLDPALRWTGLEIVDVEAGGPDDRRGTVEFRAGWRERGASGVLNERSRFVRQSGRWWYLDGRVS
jgi:SEC-C motif domain protein